jgi:hypothetical protein
VFGHQPVYSRSKVFETRIYDMNSIATLKQQFTCLTSWGLSSFSTEIWVFTSYGHSAGHQTRKHSGQARFKGRAPLFLVCKQNLIPSYWRICHIKNRQKQSRFGKVTTPKVEAVQNSKKQTTEHYNGQFLITQKILCMLLCCY